MKEAYQEGKQASQELDTQKEKIKNAQCTLESAQQELAWLEKDHKGNQEELEYLKTKAQTDPEYLCGLTTVKALKEDLAKIQKAITNLK